MNNEDLQKLKALAMAATPGPWWADKHEDWAYPQTEVLDQPTGKPITFYNNRPEYDQFMFFGTRGKAELEWANAKFIAAANPSTILAMIERIESIAAPAVANAAVGELPPLPEPLEINWPELHSQALGCGVEDRNIHDRYEAAEYGWQDGVDKAIERVPEQVYDAEQMQAYARAAIASLNKPVVAMTDEQIEAICRADGITMHVPLSRLLKPIHAILAAAGPDAKLVGALKDALSTLENVEGDRFDVDMDAVSMAVSSCRAALAAHAGQGAKE